MERDRGLTADQLSHCVTGASKQAAFDSRIQRDLRKGGAGSGSGKQQCGYQQATHRQESEN